MKHSPLAIEAAQGSTWDMDRYAESLGWEGVGIAYTHHRDSDTIYESNWQVIREDLIKHFGELNGTVLAGDIGFVYLSHWLVGWMEHLTFNTARGDIQYMVDKFHEALAEYPVLDEIHYNQLVWDKCHPTIGEYMSTHCFCSLDESCGCEGNEMACGCGRPSA